MGTLEVISMMRRRERLHRIKTACMLIAGVPLSFLGPAVLATLFWLALFLGPRSIRSEVGIGWLGMFGILSVIVVPLLYRLERQTGGEYFSNMLRDTDVRGVGGMTLIPGAAKDVVAVGTLLANPRATSSLFVEVFLFGPRMAIGGFRQARLARRVQLPDLAPAAEILEALLRRETGVETSALIGPRGTKEAILPVLAYLAFHQWIGVGQNWDRVWLDAESRRALQV